MTDLYDVLLTDILPDVFTDAEKTKAFAEAERDVRRMIYDFSVRAMIYIHLDRQKDEVLDLIAAEMKTQYYSSGFDRDTKIRMIRNTIRWHIQAGTAGAVQEMIKTVFGSGEVIEWFDYGGDPFCFRIRADDDITPDMLNKFREQIHRVKNTVSTLEAIQIHHEMVQELCVGGVLCSDSVIDILCEEEDLHGEL
ncbi:MAG: phage tail protein [Roseburia sp.]|nr:phage tail protein [Roseburia sp.]